MRLRIIHRRSFSGSAYIVVNVITPFLIKTSLWSYKVGVKKWPANFHIRWTRFWHQIWSLEYVKSRILGVFRNRKEPHRSVATTTSVHRSLSNKLIFGRISMSISLQESRSPAEMASMTLRNASPIVSAFGYEVRIFSTSSSHIWK